MNVIGTIAAERTFDLPVDPAIIDEIAKFWWPLDRLGEGLEELSRRAGLRRDAISEPLSIPPSFLAGRSFEVSDWFDWAADRLGIEAVSIDTAASELQLLFRAGGPAILLTDAVGQTGFVMILRSKRGVPQLIAPDLSIGSCRVETLRTALCWFREAPMIIEIDRVLDAAGISGRRKETVKAAMLAERLSAVRISPMWLLRLSASSSFWQQTVHAGVVGKLSGLLAVFAVMYVLEIAGWTLIGTAALGGRLDMGWLAAWVLLVMSMIPWRVAGAWFAGIFALDTGRILKSRLLAGALRMDAETIKQQGVGHLLGRVMESQALESLALSGGVAVLVAIMELGFAGWILLQGAGGATHLALLLGWSLFAFWLCWRYYVRLRIWSFGRLDMTHDLIEDMVGHRTRLAQEHAPRRETVEDTGLQNYLAASKELDTSGVFVISGASSGWMLIGLAGLLPVFVSDAAISPTAIAISLGGMLLAQRAFGGIGNGLAGLARAAIAWGQVADMFHAAHERTASHRFITDWQIRHGPAPTARLIDAQGLSFRYASTGETVLEGIDLKINHGERILLEGASGGGKSTLATLLAGLNRPASGLLLLNGLDRHTLGDDWHRIATSAPQFHENHILSGTVAFNLLMGRQWPAPPELIAEAEQLCNELGLGELLQRMPAGINQRIGETGWQLSHGERSRIFLGRALLQGAHLTVMDESFAALDPETLERCLQCALERTRSLIVIAHP